ncbi:heterokaryon incompatibility protein-domain-containing protein [Amylocarpus encephaloides]|uniref:Heterokaryon incompatibility protein-domain-containing protein n=1 Tax=Amylocarpus encephaloides TaxID=45428 RepID=A0A9P7YC36_9HELO|nr:heterokaryon incompatibility protein-domain-containing protein [Amylocarpus encephaloides]
MSIYQPLGPVRGEFRLLKLHSLSSSKQSASQENSSTAEDETPIHCELYHSFRAHKPYYEALSYTWGNASITEPILVNGHWTHVTKNLYDALKHIRDDYIDVQLWVDARCINQDDDAEKGEQVKHMRDIYGDAAKTILWLGPSQGDSDTIIGEIDRLGKFIHENGVLDDMIKLASLPSTANAEYTDMEAKVKASLEDLLQAALSDIARTLWFMRGCQALLSRPYWRRVWILQEFVVSTQISILCGKQTIVFERFYSILFYIPWMSMYVIERIHKDIMRRLENETLEEVGELIGQFKDLIGAEVEQNANRICGMRRRYHDPNEHDSTLTLIQLLAKTQVGQVKAQAGEPRDLIFGLLGMARDQDLLRIIPDYDRSKSCMDIYTSTAQKIIEAGNVDLLCLAQHRGTGAPAIEPSESFPSWVPDWRKHISRPCGQLPWDSSFRFTGPLPSHLHKAPELARQVSPNELKLQGFILDKVQYLAPFKWLPSPNGTGQNDPTLPIHLASIATLCQLSNAKLLYHSDPYPNPNDRHTAHFRIPVADMEEYGISFIRHAGAKPRNAKEEEDPFALIQRGYDGVLEAIATMEVKEHTKEIRMYYNMLGYQVFRRGMLLEKGFVGLGPDGVDVGDVVVGFRGTKFPYVLRMVKGSEGEERWKVVGEAYVHGVMYGELFQGGSEVEWVDFVLV